jgi:MFS family permease
VSEEESVSGLAISASAHGEVWQGLRIVLTHRYIRPLLGEATTFNFFDEVFQLGIMLWAVRQLHLSAGTIGLVFTAGGIGSFLGAWFGSRLTGRFGYGPVLLVALSFGNGAPLGLFASGLLERHIVLLLCAVFAVMGAGIGIANTHAVSLRQTAVPEHLTGRTNAAYRLISWGAIPLGAATGGLIASTFGGRIATLVGAAGLASATLWVAASPVPRLASIADADTNARS